MMRAPSRSSVTGTTPEPVSSRISPSCSGAASTNADPSTGWPANGSSTAGVKMRIRACPPSARQHEDGLGERHLLRELLHRLVVDARGRR